MLIRIQRFVRFPPAERRALTCIVALLGMARLTLRLSTVPGARGALLRFAPALDLPSARLAELISVAAQQLPGVAPCLPRAIVLEALLRAAGRSAELKVGVAALPVDGRPDTHAWVELDGISLDETAAVYTPLPLFGTRG